MKYKKCVLSKITKRTLKCLLKVLRSADMVGTSSINITRVHSKLRIIYFRVKLWLKVPIMGVHNITIKHACVSTAFHPLFSLYDRQFLLPTNPILHLQVLYPSTSPVLVMTTLTYHMREPTLKTQIIQSTSTILTKQLVGRVTYFN